MPLLLVPIAFFLFARVLQFPYVTFDDAHHIYQNPLLLDLSGNNFLKLWTAPYENLYIPLTYTFWWLAAWANGGPLESSPRMFHVLSFLFYVANAALVYRILKRFTDERWGALIGSIFFLVHPLHIETLGWISALKDLTSGFFALLAVDCFLASRGRGYSVATVVLSLAALLCKPWAAVLPLVFLCLDWRRWRIALASFVLTVPFVFLTAKVQSASHYTAPLALWQRGIVALDSLTFYAAKLFVPFSFTINYGRRPEVALDSSLFVYGPVLFLLALVFLWKTPYRKIYLTITGLFFISLLPTSGLIPFSYQRYSTVSDRFAYFALLGPALAVGLFWKRVDWIGSRFIVVLVLGWLSAKSYVTLGHWRDDTAIVARMTKVAPAAEHSFNLALMIDRERRGLDPVEGLAKRDLSPPKTDRERKLWLKLVELNYRRAIEINPNFAEAYYGLAHALAEQGRAVDSVAAFTEAIRSKPTFAEAYLGLGKVYESVGKKKLARNAFDKGLAIQ